MAAVRQVVNRQAFKAIRDGFVAGQTRVGQAVLERVHPFIPDAPPIGEGLVTEGSFGVWLDGEQVAGNADEPRTLATKGIVLAVGFPRPMRFYEEGTVHQIARPTLTPVMAEILPDSGRYIAPEVQARLRGG